MSTAFPKVLTIVLALSAGAFLRAQEPVFPREPLAPSRFAELPFRAIRPEGWLRDQLQRQADGMTGHLDALYPEVVGEDNAWLGGDGDTWERGPYWIDGLLPLAYLLQDDALIAKAEKWVDAMLSSAREDGYFGNATDHPYVEGLQRGRSHDWWPKMVALKILQQDYMATGNPRILEVLSGYFRYQREHLPSEPLGHWDFWAEWRAADNIEVLWWLYSLTGDPSLLETAELIHSQAVDFTALFQDGEIFRTQNSVHCVNLAQGFKMPLVWWQYSRQEADYLAPRKALEQIRTTIGFPTGLWAGDELIHFGDPARGSELCTAVEMMFSLEEMLKASGDLRWADLLERIAFNALPTQATDAYDAHQYFQQVNQIACTRERRAFVTEHWGTDNVFGLLNGYPCCACNMHQGWPKFTRNLWYASADGGLAAFVYAPSTVFRHLDGKDVTISEETFYPFSETVRFTVRFPVSRRKVRVETAAFPLYFRIPTWCTSAVLSINGQQEEFVAEDGLVRLDRRWHSGDVVELSLPMDVTTSQWYDRSTVVERGPLVYALRMDENWTRKEFTGVDREKYGPFYYEVTSDTPWNFGISLNDRSFDVSVKADDGSYPWNVEHAPVTIRAKAVRLKDWKPCNGSVGPVAYFTEDGDDTDGTETIDLIPYGCTTLRIAEFPTRR